MSSASTSLPNQLLTEFSAEFYSRRLLLHNPLYQPPTAASPPAPGNGHGQLQETYPGDNSFDTNVVMVLSVLLCALIFSLGLNSIIRCALRCSNLVASESSNGNISARTANTGIKKKALRTFTMVNFSAELNLTGLDTECAICLSEFTPGERLRLLPKCNHGFHARCIDTWLSSHSSCPKCRHCLMETCQKIVGGGQGASSSGPPATVQESSSVTVSMAPLEPEGLIRNYRGLN